MQTSKSASPLLVLGLGNPGPGYADTRHNVGYKVIDHLIKEPPVRLRRRLFSSVFEGVVETGGHPEHPHAGPLVALRYDGFMNTSGQALPSPMRRYKAALSDLIVVVDNMDLPPGAVRLRRGGGTAGHNGLKSIVSVLGDTGFLRLYIGVGRPDPGVSVVEHVLGIPDTEHSVSIEEACRRSAEAIHRLRSEHYDRVAEEFNRRES